MASEVLALLIFLALVAFSMGQTNTALLILELLRQVNVENRAVPNVWDETHVVTGRPGEYVSIARRRGREWYLGSITGWRANDPAGVSRQGRFHRRDLLGCGGCRCQSEAYGSRGETCKRGYHTES
jgi:hypothetical protein